MTALQALLVELVRSSGRTQSHLAGLIGLSEKHVSQMLTGRVEGSLAAWQRLLDAADVDLRALAGTSPQGEGEWPRHNHFTRDVKPEGQCPGCDLYHHRDDATQGGLREAVLGEVVQDLGSDDPDTGWFIVGVDGYFDVDNACWCAPEEGDAPWTSEHFRLLGTLPDLLARVERARVEVTEAAVSRDEAWAAYREAIGVPESQHQRERMERIAQHAERVEAENARLRVALRDSQA